MSPAPATPGNRSTEPAMNPLLSHPASRLYPALDPSTEAGRAALSALTQDEVEQLRAKYTQGAARRFWAVFLLPLFILGTVAVLLSFVFVAGAAARFVLAMPLSSFWGSEDLRALATIASGAGAGIALAFALAHSLLQGYYHGIEAPIGLAERLKPLSKAPSKCAVMLRRVERIPACRAYRDAVVSHRELVAGDGCAVAFIEQHVEAQEQAQKKAQERAENLARQEEACRKLHGLSPLADELA